MKLGLFGNDKQTDDAYAAKLKELNAAAAAKRGARTSGMLVDKRGPMPIPPIAGASGARKTVSSSPVYNINVTSQPGQEARTAAETKSRLEQQQPAIANGALFD